MGLRQRNRRVHHRSDALFCPEVFETIADRLDVKSKLGKCPRALAHSLASGSVSQKRHRGTRERSGVVGVCRDACADAS